MITKAAHGHTSEKGTGRARSMKLLCSSSHSIAVSVVFNSSTAPTTIACHLSRHLAKSRIPATTIVSHQSIEVIEAKGPPAVKVTMKRSREAVRYGGHSDEATLIHELLGLPDAPTEGEDRIGEDAVANVVRHIQARLPQSEYVSSFIGRGQVGGFAVALVAGPDRFQWPPFPPISPHAFHISRARLADELVVLLHPPIPHQKI